MDPHAVGESYCTHVRREREEHGRECPGQWSWIGGLVGPTNPTWHLEMRDFLVLPQYEYTAEGMLLHRCLENDEAMLGASIRDTSFSESSLSSSSVFAANIARPLILYGSETGTAEGVARDLKRQLKLLKPMLLNLNEASKLEMLSKRNISHVICICSTFGKGEPPKNASEFFSVDFDEVSLPPVKFAVLALGSTLYPDFCKAGLDLDTKLAATGMERIVPLSKADEASGAFDVIRGWTKSIRALLLPPNVEQELQSRKALSKQGPQVTVLKWINDPKLPLQEDQNASEAALCISNTELLEPPAASSRSIRKVSFEHPHGHMYSSGDHLAVHPINLNSSVDRFLDCFRGELTSAAKSVDHCPLQSDCTDEQLFNWILNQPFELECVQNNESVPADVFFETPTTLKRLVAAHLDLALETRSLPGFLEFLTKCLDDFVLGLKEVEAHRLSLHEQFQEFVELSSPALEEFPSEDAISDIVASYPTVFNLLERYRDLFLEDFVENVLGRKGSGPILKVAEVLAVLPKLQARFYSISSSSKANPKTISISVGVLETNTTNNVPVQGVCSHFIANLRPGIDRARVLVRPSTFRLPEDIGAPLIMVGAGTGLAPLLGFMEDRAIEIAQMGNDKSNPGPLHLFFGCRTESDFIYKDKVDGFVQSGMVSLHLALSRSNATPKRYVQDKIAESREEVCRLILDPRTHYYGTFWSLPRTTANDSVPHACLS